MKKVYSSVREIALGFIICPFFQNANGIYGVIFLMLASINKKPESLIMTPKANLMERVVIHMKPFLLEN